MTARNLSFTTNSRPDPLTVMAIGAVAYALANVLHEGVGHLLLAWLLGGSPEIFSTTDVVGDWSALSRWEIRAVAAGGSLVNLAAAGISWALLRTMEGEAPNRFAGLRQFLFLFMSVSLFIPGTYMIVSPIAGFGDWNTFARGLEPEFLSRAVLVLMGIAVCGVAVRIGKKELSELSGRETGMRDRARMLTLPAYLTGGAMAILAAALGQLPLGRSLLVAAGWSLGCTWWLAALPDWLQHAQMPKSGTGIELRRDRRWIAAGLATFIVFVGLLGPGLRLG